MRTSGSRLAWLVTVAMVVCPLPVPAADDSGEYLGDGHVDSGEDSAAELARAVQNPVADPISVPSRTTRTSSSAPRRGRSTA